ncbi:beta-ketoacyl-ACP synthase II [soil metagenome]
MAEPISTVVVTGIGCMSPLAAGRERSWRRLISAEGGVRAIDRFDTKGYPSRIAAQVPDFHPEDYLERKDARRTDRYIQFGMAASREALDHGRYEIDPATSDRVGVIIGSAMGGLETFEEGYKTLQERGPGRVSPFFVPMMLADMAAGFVSIQIGARGPNFATLSACASGAHAIGEAAATIRRGDADVMLAGGSEAPIVPSALAGFAAAGALSTRNDDPEHASRPFDLGRNGFVIGEGGAVLLLESLEHATARNAEILAVVSGYATTADASHIVQPAPHGEGAARAMTLALERACLEPRDISYINAHGTSTKMNDKFETEAMKSVYCDGLPPVSSTKGATGHLLGAAPAIEAAFSVMALQTQTLPPTINYETPDPDCELDCVPNAARETSVRHVMSNSFGFGGHNAVLIFSQFEPR